MNPYSEPAPPASGRGQMGIRAAIALMVVGALALAWWGYRTPDLFLGLVSLPFC